MKYYLPLIISTIRLSTFPRKSLSGLDKRLKTNYITMNKIINLLSVFCFIAVIATSCEKEPILEVSLSSFNFSDQGSSQTISFSTNKDWSASVSGGSWCTISPASGSSDVKSITVSVTANDTYDDRSATITITAEELTKVITISQPKNKAILLTKGRYEVGTTGGVISVELRANIEYDVTIPTDNQSWITNTTTKGLVTSNLTFAIAANATYDSRQGKIIIKEKTSTLSDTVYVSQTQKDAIILTSKTHNVADTAITISVEMKSNVTYLVTIPTAAQLWITQAQTKALKTEQLQFNIARNTAFQPRSAEIIVRQSLLTLADTLYINQDKAPSMPIVTTYDAFNVTTSSFSIRGNVTADGGALVLTRGACWSKNENPTIEDTKISNGDGTGIFTTELKGLEQSTTYFVRAYATNRAGTGYGNSITIKTFEGLIIDVDGNTYPTVKIGTQTWMAENLKTTKYRNGDLIGTTIPATLNISEENTPKYQWAYLGNESNVATYGRLYTWYAAVDRRNICPTGWHLPTDTEWTTLTTYLGGTSVAGGKLKETGIVNWQSPNKDATNSSSFTALPGGRHFNQEPTFDDIGTVGHWWSSTENYPYSPWARTIYNNSSHVNRHTTAWSIGFSVRCVKGEAIYTPSISTTAAIDITSTSATIGGNITSDGGSIITAKGVCWSTNQTPTTNNSKTNEGVNNGNFISSIDSLLPGTRYYVRAYADNIAGTAYGNEETFVTNTTIPTITTTTTTTLITSTGFTSGGNVISDGGSIVTVRGVCWSTSPNPTILDSKSIDGSGLGSFTSTITCLTPRTTYNIRAYATNRDGTAYGNSISLFTGQLFNPDLTYGTLTDIEGNIYKTILIGTQTWMAENLKTTKYRNGDLIGTTIPTTLNISEENTPKYQWAYLGNELNIDPHGRLYTWYAATDSRNICPTGWHLPSDTELTTLRTYLGGTSVAGGKLKETVTNHWRTPNTEATNSSGFTALPSGLRFNNGTFRNNSYYGYWWSSTESSLSFAWSLDLYYNLSNAYRDVHDKRYGYSVRCVRDN